MAEYAVLLPWIRTEYGDCLLMEVRSQHVRQPGEVCFPGGRIESGETPAECAVRETCEELGLEPADIEVVSEPETEIMTDGRVVYSVPARIHVEDISRLRISEDEVAEVFLLPSEWIRTNPPAHFDLALTEDKDLPPVLLGYLRHYGEYRRRGTTDYWEYEGHGIWGLTARILKRLTRI